MFNRSVVLISMLLSLAAPAQDAALVVNCSDCNAFQGLEVHLDGAAVNTGNIQSSVRVDGIAPGDHEVKVYKWNSPFSREELGAQVIKFPRGTELRVKTTNGGKLVVYGKGQLAAPVAAAPAGPSREQWDNAREFIDEAREYAKEAADATEEADNECSIKVAGKLEVISDNLKDLKSDYDAALMRKTISKADDTRGYVNRECPKSFAKSMDKKLTKIVGRLQKAEAQLR